MTVEFPKELAALGDRGVRAAIVLIAIGVAGFVGIGLGWRGTNGESQVAFQLPFVVSAGFGGVALIGSGTVLLGVHLERRAAAVRRAAFETAIRGTAEVVDALSRRALGEPDSFVIAVSRTMHRPACRVVAGRVVGNKLDAAVAKAQGLRACRICQPGRAP